MAGTAKLKVSYTRCSGLYLRCYAYSIPIECNYINEVGETFTTPSISFISIKDQMVNAAFSEVEIKEILAKHQPRHVPQPGGKPASVLVPFYKIPDGLSLILTKRPDYPGIHGDQISFPGGGREEDDKDNLETALRETEEEIGVKKDQVDVWGALSTQRTLSSSFRITPFVGSVPYPYDFKPDSREVERLLIIPFSHLLNPASYSYGPFNWKGMMFETDLYRYENDIIWGLTARIINRLITLIITGREDHS